ncbi:Deoxyribonuclease NucA/NucB [Streptosporangium subroseum]|uniref:Deoxyribonuclease NucA/NucB n=2 Tax=Streptosporangium subroseum TaxID=106412 RepID=A0A239NS75_9ACTN|nr:Deoxyribonuclease NucA/NucB [Streptosporangium subroseum]
MCRSLWATCQYPDSCDEYPFASTKEGAASTPSNYSVELIKLEDNCASGSRLGWFYQQNRIIPEHRNDRGLMAGTPFYVSVVTSGPSNPKGPSTPDGLPLSERFCDEQ